jgi:hypothetical protein
MPLPLRYLSTRRAQPLRTTDGGTLRTIGDAIAALRSRSSDIATRPIDAGDETLLNRVAPVTENDGDRVGRRFGCPNCQHDHAHLTTDEIGG